jgi:CRP-like cAMP-binding protein
MVSPELLRRYPFFASISDTSLKQVAMMAAEKRMPAGETMFYEHDPADHLYVIIQGEVNISYTLGNGEQRVVDTLVDGDLLVWSALVEPYRTTGIGTTTKETRLIAIPAADLRKLCVADPELGARLMEQVVKLLAHRLVGARVQLATV